MTKTTTEKPLDQVANDAATKIVARECGPVMGPAQTQALSAAHLRLIWLVLAEVMTPEQQERARAILRGRSGA